ncbi:GNAT family N-acetyltransferase [Paenibacillus sp. KACC 21273]|uniref:GNAT family N-acetyltransferase n=1 Tax=Paenibacillus sp. KACC 21273 TaxID=3025665 RepID=UPI00308252DF
MNSNICLKPLTLANAEQVLQLRNRNRDYLKKYEPIRPESYWTLEAQQEMLINGEHNFEAGQGYVFGIFESVSEQLVGRIEISGVARGPFQNGNLGYFVDQDHHGKGYASAAVQQCLQFAFIEAQLHRLQAGVMPWNTPSLRVLEKSGFRREGLAERYLHINGNWEDHVLYAITIEDWQRFAIN